MKIIKHGNTVLPNLNFVCQKCHCEFIATPNEYFKNITSHGPIVVTTFCECPECRYLVTWGEMSEQSHTSAKALRFWLE